MTTVNYSGNEELDFRLIFGEDLLAPQPPGPNNNNNASGQDGREVRTFDNFYSLISQHVSQDLQQGYGEVLQGSQYTSAGNLRSFDCPSIQITNSHPDTGSQDAKASGGAESQGTEQPTWSRDNLYLSLDPYYRDANLNPSPGSSLSSRSWLSDISSCESFSHVYDDVDGELNEAAARFTLGSPHGTPTPSSPLPSPGCGGGAFGVEIWQQQYQNTLAFTQAVSPHQSPRQSPCPSPRHSPRNSVTDENWLNPRPTSRSNSRPTSPCGKRRHSSADGRARSPSPHHSPSPTPGGDPGLSPGHSPRGSVTEDSWIGSPTLGPVLYGCYPELDVPSKTRRTTGTQLAALCGQGEELGAPLPFLNSPGGGEECVQRDVAELFLPVPSFSWIKPTPGTTPLFRNSSLPPLDWPLPSQYGPCELQIEVQPRNHHRAHYETEGSRGSVKAASGGHPVVKLNGYNAQPVNLQVFIGTADERYLRPHAFYQVHRVTGKTVSTLCLEKTIGITKILEIPLLPENGMTTSIDCAGILKLRNSDIELRKGETDIGRKNTRARVVFRVDIPQPDGKFLCLQAASVPIECSQRSALELPQVDGFSPASCAADGGAEMVITGSNLAPESRVIFVEKGPDGRTQWEVDVKAIPEKSSGGSIVVEIPPYHNTRTTTAAQVHFYVSNGKRKRSLTQSFTYLAGACAAAPPFCFVPAPGGRHGIKQERCDLDYTTPAHNPPGVYSTAAAQLPSPDRAFCPPDRSFYDYAAPQPQPAYSPARTSPLRLHSSHLQRGGFGPDAAGGQPRINAMQTLDLGLASQAMPSSQTVPYSHHQSGSPLRPAAVPAGRSEHQSGPLSPDQQHQHHPAPVPSITRLPTTGPCESLSPSQSTSLHLSAPQTKASSSPSSSQKPQDSSSPGAPRRALLLGSADPRRQQHASAPHSLFSSPGHALSVKQEPDELPHHQACTGLQEITLDDVNEIIDRDIFQLSSGADMVLETQDPYGWDQNSADTALQYCGSLQ